MPIGTLSEPESDKVPINGSDKQVIIWEYLAKHDFVTSAELAELLGISQRSVLKILKKLMDNGSVLKTGSNRDAKYSLYRESK